MAVYTVLEVMTVLKPKLTDVLVHVSTLIVLLVYSVMDVEM